MRSALIVVDMANDFLMGSYVVPGAHEIIVPIQEEMCDTMKYSRVVLTRCNHPKDHCSFKAQGGPHPEHCVADTYGAEIQCGIGAIAALYQYPIFDKGPHKDKEELSGFHNPNMDNYLRTHNIKRLFICGVARDYCVAETAADARKYGYETIILEHLTRRFHPTQQSE